MTLPAGSRLTLREARTSSIVASLTDGGDVDLGGDASDVAEVETAGVVRKFDVALNADARQALAVSDAAKRIDEPR